MKKTTNKKLSPLQVLHNKKRVLINKRDIKDFLFRLLFLLVFLFLIFGVFFKVVISNSDDMKPTIRARDLQLVYRFPSHLFAGDIIVYGVDGVLHTGRIAARPNDSVEITKESKLVVNGSEVSETEIYYDTPLYDADVEYPIQLKEDEYFILSDFRSGAIDSREFGPVKRESIIGKVITVLRRSGL